jgi:hypothetical protein
MQRNVCCHRIPTINVIVYSGLIASHVESDFEFLGVCAVVVILWQYVIQLTVDQGKSQGTDDDERIR